MISIYATASASLNTTYNKCVVDVRAHTVIYILLSVQFMVGLNFYFHFIDAELGVSDFVISAK